MKLLNEIQQKIDVKKTRSAGRYNYHNCEDILNAVKPMLGDGTLTLSDEIICVGVHNYMKATATLTDGNNESVIVTGWSKEPLEMMKGMDQCKISGTASSYARKYALNGMFGINDVPDADELTVPDGQPKQGKDNQEFGF
jgi:hypothetical protein